MRTLTNILKLATIGPVCVALFAFSLMGVEDTSASIERVIGFFNPNPVGTAQHYDEYQASFNNKEYTVRTYGTNMKPEQVIEKLLTDCDANPVAFCRVFDNGVNHTVAYFDGKISRVVTVPDDNGRGGLTHVSDMISENSGQQLNYTFLANLRNDMQSIDAEAVLEGLRRRGVSEADIAMVRTGELGIVDLYHSRPELIWSDPVFAEMLSTTTFDNVAQTSDKPGFDLNSIGRMPASRRVASVHLENKVNSRAISYESTHGINHVFDFYRNELSSKGWVTMDDPVRMMADLPKDRKYMMFMKQGDVALVSAQQENGTTTASIMLLEGIL